MNESYCTGSGGSWGGMSCSGGSQAPRRATPEEIRKIERWVDEFWAKRAEASKCFLILGKPDTLENTKNLIGDVGLKTGRTNADVYLDITNGTYVASIGDGTPGYNGWPSMRELKRRGLIPRDGYCVPRNKAEGIYVKIPRPPIKKIF